MVGGWQHTQHIHNEQGGDGTEEGTGCKYVGVGHDEVKLKEEEEERQGGGWVVQGGVRDEDSVEVIHELV